jgi:hypothetical protein
MQKKRIETQAIEIVDKFCDICGEPTKGRGCKICHRDICGEHGYHHWDEWGGDSSTKYCTECWQIGESFRRRKSVLSEIYEQETDELEKAWEKKALEKIAQNAKRKMSKSET